MNPAPTTPWGEPYVNNTSRVLLGGIWNPPSCAHSDCPNESGYLESPFCGDCIWRLWAYLDATQPEQKKDLARKGRIDEIHRMEATLNQRATRVADRSRRERATEPGTIYYLRVGDLIKIGFTADIDQRMKHYPPNTELLAQHPGTRQTERRMHHKFLHHRASGREWFTPSDDITQHIEEVKARYKQEAP